MTKHLPPVPPAARSNKGPGDNPKLDVNSAPLEHPGERNLDQQGRQGNSKQNTTHQGYQQDR
jgi:hypothetical protein